LRQIARKRQLASEGVSELARTLYEITAESWECKNCYSLAQGLLSVSAVQSSSPEAEASTLSRKPRTCPHCDSTYVARSRRQGLWGMPVVRLLGVHIYRCTECWRRFHGIQRRRISTRAA